LPSKYEKGSLLQKVLEPFAGAKKDEDGTLNYTLEDKEIALLVPSDEILMKELERFKESGEVWEVEDDDEDMFRMTLMKELEDSNSKFNEADFRDVFDKEINVFKKGDEYHYVTDLKDAYKDSLKLSTEAKIFQTIPDYYFWDIKVPL